MQTENTLCPVVVNTSVFSPREDYHAGVTEYKINNSRIIVKECTLEFERSKSPLPPGIFPSVLNYKAERFNNLF